MPGVSETIDWVTALVALDRDTLDAEERRSDARRRAEGEGRSRRRPRRAGRRRCVERAVATAAARALTCPPFSTTSALRPRSAEPPVSTCIRAACSTPSTRSRTSTSARATRCITRCRTLLVHRREEIPVSIAPSRRSGARSDTTQAGRMANGPARRSRRSWTSSLPDAADGADSTDDREREQTAGRACRHDLERSAR